MWGGPGRGCQSVSLRAHTPAPSQELEGFRDSDADALEIEFMDLYGLDGDRCKTEVAVGFVGTNPGLDCSYGYE